MRALLQRVISASVSIQDKEISRIGSGLLVFLGVGPQDGRAEAERLVRKILALRIFEDSAGKMNLSLLDAGGEMLVVSQFTLYADCRKGNRPSFTDAALPDAARSLYETFVKLIERDIPGRVCTGEFGADMKVALVNDGPVTIQLDTAHLMGMGQTGA